MEDSLQVGFNKEMATTGDRIVYDTHQQLERLRENFVRKPHYYV
ncbi:hypothetical protein PJF56_13330 [Roseofilum sp. BLCC_M91]|uniref:Uncharacterized protein n=1 Tax=Roseofilum halophilum BLCC-M91 TaxID=3022259 RepID=A0ABT7BKY0_9CYAN|nr:hypothetical protein [Roseofilum halophilum]MDJ1179849.1 hypothetical protein [Roseofilum halophilum BLCC-M91]